MAKLKKYILLLFSCAVFHNYAQIGPASLSVGADEVLFQKGVLDVELLGEIISEKQDEVKKELVKRILLNKTFNKGPYLTYHYADQVLNTVIAYEPIWAIGTGVTATSAQAQEMHKELRGHVSSKFGETVADDTTILYGGSCKPTNAEELFACPDVDGGLIGGASLKARDFTDIIKSF